MSHLAARASSRRRIFPALVGSVLVLGLVACTAAPATTPTPVVEPTVQPSATPSPTPAPTPEPTSVPLGGGPVLAVKIDHVDAAYPRAGHSTAAVVYVDEVEYGLTRLMAVFVGDLPEKVGPIRSARPNDPTILANFGPVPLVHSGASGKTYVYLDAGSHIDVPDGSVPGGFFREGGGRSAPHNLMGNPTVLLAGAGGSQPPRDVGFRYGPAPEGGRPATGVSTRYPAASMAARFDAATGAFEVRSNGRVEIDALTGAPVAPTTIVVQKVVSGDSDNVTSAGSATPLTELVGSGEALVLREGQLWEGTWERTSLEAPTSFRVGEDELTFAEGQTWLWFVPTDQAVTVD